jgi:hypothetical protein
MSKPVKSFAISWIVFCGSTWNVITKSEKHRFATSSQSQLHFQSRSSLKMPMYDRKGEVKRKTEKFLGVSAKVMLSLHKWRTKKFNRSYWKALESKFKFQSSLKHSTLSANVFPYKKVKRTVITAFPVTQYHHFS